MLLLYCLWRCHEWESKGGTRERNLTLVCITNVSKSIPISYKNLLTTPTLAGDAVEVHTCMLQAGRRRSQPGGCLQLSFPATRRSETTGKWPLSLPRPATAFGLPQQQEKAAAELSEAARPAANWDRARSWGGEKAGTPGPCVCLRDAVLFG